MNIPISEVIRQPSNNTPRWRSRKRKYFYIHLIPYVYVSSLPFNYCLIASKHNAIKKDRINVSWKRNCFILILCLLCVFLQIQIQHSSWVTKFYYATTTIKDFDYGGKPTWNVCLMIHALKCRILTPLYLLLRGIFFMAEKQCCTFWQQFNTTNKK